VVSFIWEYRSAADTKSLISNNDWIVKLEFRIIVIVDSLFEFPSHPTNSFPSSGVAVIVTSVPSSNVPPSVETVPPSPAVTVSVYWVGAGGYCTGLYPV